MEIRWNPRPLNKKQEVLIGNKYGALAENMGEDIKGNLKIK